ncbi:hypothetical protein [Bacillus sp. FJAT-47783]|uniref:hypothetical protein n=1 Tax=Bacillus sp. FJAT-47783 TaxID=2922712 RepID=UPI001FABAE50|nr:hypothetical protein [Bacillus sp. FJAT-47783]
MVYDETVLTDEEKRIVSRLKDEMLQALSVQHMRFYKQEIERLIEQAERRSKRMASLQNRMEAM